VTARPLQVTGLGTDHDGELDLPVRPQCHQRDPYVVIGATQGVRMLEEDDRVRRGLVARLGRVRGAVLTMQMMAVGG